jgi:N utilization substance protein B
VRTGPQDLPLPGHEDDEVELLRTVPANTHHLSARSRARVRAIDVAYEADARGTDLLDTLAERRIRTAAQTPLPELSADLVRLLAGHVGEVDEQLSTHSRDWPLDRMPAVDRAVLRLGAAEILFGDEPATAAGALIGEYTTISRELSTEQSPKFVNGLLQRVADMRDLLG